MQPPSRFPPAPVLRPVITTRGSVLETLAAPQGGVVSRAQLLGAGWSSSGIARAVAGDRLRPVARGVYRVTGSGWTQGSAYHAARLLVGADGVVSHRSAAALHGFVDPVSGPVEVTAGHTTRTRADAGQLLRLHRTRSMPDGERTEIDGLPVTSGSRTLLDLAARLRRDRLAELLSGAIRVRATTLDDVRSVAAAHPNRRGRGRLLEAVELLSDDGAASRSDVEVAALAELVAAGLPRPLLAHRVRAPSGRLLAEVDLAYPDLRIAIEIDGYRWHMSPARKHADEVRQNRLVLAGWLVLRFGASDVRAHPARLVAAVRRAIEARRR